MFIFVFRQNAELIWGVSPTSVEQMIQEMQT